MITYREFIEELRNLVDEARSLRSAKDMHEDESFRKWRNKLEGLLSQITQVNYLLPCPVRTKSRHFGGYGYTPDENQKEQLFIKYKTEIDDTINELEFVIESYEKHGEPPKGGNNPEDLEMPKVITAVWLFRHAPIKFWIKVLTLAVAILSFGVYLGQTDIFHKASDLFSVKQNESKIMK